MCDTITYMDAALDSYWCAKSIWAGWSNALEGKPMLESWIRYLGTIVANGTCIPARNTLYCMRGLCQQLLDAYSRYGLRLRSHMFRSSWEVHCYCGYSFLYMFDEPSIMDIGLGDSIW